MLDIGRGSGFFPIMFGMHGYAIDAMDHSEIMVELTQSNCRECGIETRIQRMNTLESEFDDGSFDLINNKEKDLL